MTADIARHKAPSWRTASGAAGLAVLTALWLGPLQPLSRTSFSAHMLLHLGLVLAAAPLLALPLAARLKTPASFGEALGWYLLAASIETLAVWGWHVPLLHDRAGHNVLLYGAEQISFVLGGVVLWIAIFTARNATAAISAILIAALTFAHMTMFGLLLAVVPSILYDPSLCQGGFGLDRLNDQHLGGALMAAGGLAYLAAATALIGRAVCTSILPVPPGCTQPPAASTKDLQKDPAAR